MSRVANGKIEMEVIAALASVAQLTSYAINLIKAVSDIHERIEGRPAHLRRQRCQLELLESTLQHLSQNKVLNTPSVREHLEVISTRIESLNALLEKEASKRTQGWVKKYCRAWIGDKTQQRTAEIFEDIEGNKTALLLSIEETNAGVSDRIYSTLTEGLSSIHERMSQNKADNLGGVCTKNETRTVLESHLNDDRRENKAPITALRTREETHGEGCAEESSRATNAEKVRHRAGQRRQQPPVLTQCPSAHTPQPNQKPDLKAQNGNKYRQVKLGEETSFAFGDWGPSETNNAASNNTNHEYEDIKIERASKGIMGNVNHVQSAKEMILNKKDKEGNK